MFCRFAGCNLWTGRERDRHRAICQFCDTDFVGHRRAGRRPVRYRRRPGRRRGRGWQGQPHRAEPAATSCAPAASRCCSSTRPRSSALHAVGFEVAVETNGTRPPPPGLDWICVSPKAGADLALTSGRRAQARLSRRPGAEPERFERPRLRAASCCSRWTARTARRNTRAADRVLPGAPAVAAEPADPQVPGNLPTMEIFREFTFEAAHRLPNVPRRAQVRPPARPLLPGRGARPGRRRATTPAGCMDFGEI